jgi:Fic family protein
MKVREKNDIVQWFKFFLVGVIETTKSGIDTFDAILKLQKETDIKTQTLRSRAANAQKVINFLYQKPMINAEKLSVITGLSSASSYKLIEDLVRLDILKEVTGAQRGRIYIFEQYIKLFR